MTSPVLKAHGLHIERGDATILEECSLSVPARATVLIEGASGSGKTTLFEVLGLLDDPTAGSLMIAGTDVLALSERKRARVRRDDIGIVYQDFQLIPDLTARENAALPQTHRGDRDDEWLDTVFERLGITDLADRYPTTLSGGEKQRVAIARAVANKPRVILADEPTGQLDPATADQVLSLLLDAKDLAETSLVTVSHDPRIQSHFDVIYRLADGHLTEQNSHATT